MRQTEEDLNKHLKEQIQFLLSSCMLYDQGHTAEAKRIATGIRTLVHDKNSVSLLTHLDCKNKFYYYNTAIPGSIFGLTGITTTTEGNGKTFYYAPFDNGSEKRKENPWITFNNWWEIMDAMSDGKVMFSRKELVLALANKDGGAHIDKKLGGKYADLSRNNSMNVFHLKPDGQPVNVEKVELACVRQIAYELLTTLKRKFPNHFPKNT